MDQARELLSPSDLAELLGVSLSTIYSWRNHGSGPVGIKVGRHVRFRREDVDEWLDAHREQRAMA